MGFIPSSAVRIAGNTLAFMPLKFPKELDYLLVKNAGGSTIVGSRRNSVIPFTEKGTCPILAPAHCPLSVVVAYRRGCL